MAQRRVGPVPAQRLSQLLGESDGGVLLAQGGSGGYKMAARAPGTASP